MTVEAAPDDANAIADRIDAGEAGLEARVHGDESLLRFQAQQRGQRRLVLTDRLDDLICRSTNSDPVTGCGAGRPDASGAPSSTRRHSRPTGLPSSSTTREGWLRKRNSMPSLRAKSYSCS